MGLHFQYQRLLMERSASSTSVGGRVYAIAAHMHLISGDSGGEPKWRYNIGNWHTSTMYASENV
jgi:hypothetical protein